MTAFGATPVLALGLTVVVLGPTVTALGLTVAAGDTLVVALGIVVFAEPLLFIAFGAVFELGAIPSWETPASGITPTLPLRAVGPTLSMAARCPKLTLVSRPISIPQISTFFIPSPPFGCSFVS